MKDNAAEHEGFLAWMEGKLRKPHFGKLKAIHQATQRSVDSYECEPGEPTEDFVLRVWNELESDAESFDGKQTYFLQLFREQSLEPEATRTVRVLPPEEDASSFGDDKSMLAQSHRHTEQFAKIMERLAVNNLARADQENDRLLRRMTTMEDAQFELFAHLRRAALDTGEQQIRMEQARTEALITGKALEQLELIAPIIMSKLMGQAKDESPGGALERELLKKFIGTLPQEKQMLLLSQLDGVQRMAVAELIKGEVDPRFEAVLIQRIMVGITDDQLRVIADLCDEGPQLETFRLLYEQRKKSLAYAASKAKQLGPAENAP